MSGRERAVASGVALGFLAAAAAIALVVPANRPDDVLLLCGLVALAAVARTVRLEVGNAEVTADQLAFIPILLLAPLPLVPILIVVAYLLAGVPDLVRGRVRSDRWLYVVGDAWHAIGAVAVIAALAPGPLAFVHVPVYALALVGQCIAGLALVVTSDCLVNRSGPLQTVRLRLPGYRIELMLTPVAYLVAATGAREPVAMVGVLPLMWLLSVFSTERRKRFAAALELKQAYRGTVMVLSDVVEADDNYTASHCRSVVQLATAVADELGLEHDALQDLEMAALLHDVGKLAIPNEILNKPAKLTHEEFDVVKTHTVEGQALLDRVGGRLERVGQIVRSCHERWDGDGYPDGLMGGQIPQAARIVFCCDAYSAMTTDRPYRGAMSPEAALEELRANSGSQFEPRVVAAMEKVAHSSETMDDPQYTDALRAVLGGATPPEPVALTV